ncbi:MAG: flavin reductase family protein [Acidobacteriota bacterium]
MSVNRDEYRKTVGHFATGVTIVTTQNAEGQPYGLTVNAFTSVSLDPFLVLVCLSNHLSGLEAFQESNRFAVNLLAADQENLSNHFATPGSDRSQGPYTNGKTGIPVLEGVLARLECDVSDRFPGGDHTIMMGQVQSAEIVNGEKEPLLYYGGKYRELK